MAEVPSQLDLILIKIKLVKRSNPETGQWRWYIKVMVIKNTKNVTGLMLKTNEVITDTLATAGSLCFRGWHSLTSM
jgi:hypothetical protein